MDVIDAITSRYSVRAYKSDALSRETIEKMLSTAAHAPSWANTQPWEVFIAAGDVLHGIREAYAANFRNRVHREPDLEVLAEWPQAHEQRMSNLREARTHSLEAESNGREVRQSMFDLNARMFGAPAVAFICMDKRLGPWSIYDLGLFSQTLMLAATALGVGSIPAFNLVAYPSILREKLGIPEDLRIIMGIALGLEDVENPNNHYRSPRRKTEEFAVIKGI